jgi:23S rRNA (guanosine2251-2'-O)-methyltransferase
LGVTSRLPAIVILDNVRSLYNTGAFFRTADACGVEKLVLCGITPRPDQGRRQRASIAKTALVAETAMPWEHESDAGTAVDKAVAAGYQVAVVEPSPDAVDLYAWRPVWPVCLVFGHETAGVESAVASRIATHVRIPMFGVKRSLNVATAGGVVLYELLRRRLPSSGDSGAP